ncbi:GNAT family N-acetyltransferase [Arthrobacter sp.]|uniref:GNAT family N-acetyltransferase n=1 Tax=Arthrobacter sp. TaxID=1667 RepID=UPI003A94D801
MEADDAVRLAFDAAQEGLPAGQTAALVLREAGCDDIQAIMELNDRAKRAGGTLASYLAVVEDAQRLLVVACSGTDVVGWAKTHWWGHADESAPAGHYLGGVTVDPAWRRRGIGTKLTRIRLHWIWGRTPDAWYVVNATNTASIAMHRDFGFTEIARATAFHTTGFEDGNGLLMHAQRPIGFPNQ